jgi:hypothetical protein
LHQDVVHAVVDEVRANGAMPVHHERDLELGAYAISARHQHRFLPRSGIELEEPPKGADVRQHAGRERTLCERANAADGLVAGVDVDT